MTNFRLNDPDIILIHIPKTGGTSVQNLWTGRVAERTFGHWRSEWDELPSVAIIRHPVDRFLSALRMFKFGNFDLVDYYETPRMPNLTIARALDILADDSIGFDRAIRDLKSNLKHHMLPQTHPFQCLDRAKTILRTETLSHEFPKFANSVRLNGTLPHIRQSRLQSFANNIQPTDAEMERIRIVFDEDFRQLGYNIDEKSIPAVRIDKVSQKTIWAEWPAFFSDARMFAESASDALPDKNCDLSVFREESVKSARKRTWPGREKNLLEHFRKLQGEFGGLSRISHLLACCIVVIRRTKGSGPGIELFHRILREHGDLIATEVNLRWLTSICDTLVDFGENENQRSLALNGSMLMSVVKLYETERRVFHPARPWPPKARMQNGGELFDGVITFWTSNGDMIENMLARLETLIDTDRVSGKIVGELVFRLTREDTALRRFMEIADVPPKAMIKPHIKEWLEKNISRHL